MNCPLQHGFSESEVNKDQLHGFTYHGKTMLHSMWAMGMAINSAWGALLLHLHNLRGSCELLLWVAADYIKIIRGLSYIYLQFYLAAITVGTWFWDVHGVSVMHRTKTKRPGGYASEQLSWSAALVPRGGRPRPWTWFSCDLTEWSVDHVSATPSLDACKWKTGFCQAEVDNIDGQGMRQEHSSSLCACVIRVERSWHLLPSYSFHV
jgi:hypothetical protein